MTVAALSVACLLLCDAALADAKVSVPLVPQSLQSGRFKVTINGKPAAFVNAAANYYELGFDLQGKAKIAITAPDADYWAKGVEVQPWRQNIRPVRQGATITFTLDHAAKLSISRPGDHLGGAEMLFIFANAPEVNPPSPNAPGIRYYGPGIHKENIDAHSGDRIYLAPGAFVFGSLNLWDVEDVEVSGRGTIIYEGPQNPTDDEGWRQRRNWHVIGMNRARKVSVNGITCIVRSRTWMIQMKESHGILLENLKVIGGSPGNANQDGMDFVGSGDAVVRDVFIRAADDVFAMLGNWDGYTPDVISIPGLPVSNILVEKSVLSTSISNVLRLAWPHKVFDSNHFTMRDSDVIHMGIGGCGIPFALFELWSEPGGIGTHSDVLFDDVRLESWYALAQVVQGDKTKLHNVTFRNIWSPELPGMVGSAFTGAVDGVTFDHVKIADHVATNARDLQIFTGAGTAAPTVSDSSGLPHAAFAPPASVVHAGLRGVFDASSSAATAPGAKIVAYDWFFGDGTIGHGRVVRHAMPDDQGTLLDGSGRFRVMLRVTDDKGKTDWTTHPVIVTNTLRESLGKAADKAQVLPGLKYAYYKGAWPTLPDFSAIAPVASGIAETLSASAHPHSTNYGFVFEGLVNIPADGGYSFTLHSRDGGRLVIDGTTVAQSPKVWPLVCGLVGNSVQAATGTVGLAAGLHKIRVEITQTAAEDAFDLLWEGSNVQLQRVPDSVLVHQPDAVN